MNEPKRRIRLVSPKDHFSVPSKDANGDSARLNFRLMASMTRLIQVVTRSGNVFGWQSPSDFLRWAVKNALGRVVELEDDTFLSNLNQQTNTIIEIINDENRLKEERAAMDKIENTVRELKLTQDHEGVRITLQKLKREIGLMNDRRVRERWQRHFEERFGHLLGKETNDQ